MRSSSSALPQPPADARFAPPVPLAELAAASWVLEPVAPHERRSVMRPEAAELLDPLLSRVARARGAIDVALGEGLSRLAVGDRLLRLGYASVADYAREVLGVAGRTAQAMVRLGRELSVRPLLREAVRSGEVSARKAQAVIAVALGGDEAAWVERARVETVRALEAAVREARRHRAGGPGEAEPDAGASDDGDGEAWERVRVSLPDGAGPVLDRAMELAGRLLGAASPKWQRLEAVCQEYLGAHAETDPSDPDGAGDPFDSLHEPVSTWMGPLRAWLEEETGRWRLLETLEPVASPRLDADALASDPRALDAELRALAALRDRWDELLGHLAMLVRSVGLWREMGFASFSHYCAERLGLAARTVEQRTWLERRLYELPELRLAMRQGRVSYEKARVVAGAADAGSLDAWIDRAERSTCAGLRREAEAAEDAQMCARGELSLAVPGRVARLLAAALGTARAAAGTWIGPEECFRRILEHFVATWEDALPRERSTPRRRAMERDGGRCQAPGCTRPAVHAHHVVYRSRGGGDGPENLVSLCAAHHLHGVHRGLVRVRGVAPGGLTWALGEVARA